MGNSAFGRLGLTTNGRATLFAREDEMDTAEHKRYLQREAEFYQWVMSAEKWDADGREASRRGDDASARNCYARAERCRQNAQKV